MPIIGQTSRTIYHERDILSPLYLRMQNEVLIREEDDSQVIPVRNQVAPHFRIIRQGVFRERIGLSEAQDPTHGAAIAYLMERCTSSRLVVSTTVFGEGGNDRSTQTIFRQEDREYHWFREHACRIPLGDGRYIEPDLCGRDQQSFHPSNRSPTIIIEVIQSHPPDEAAFLELERMSAHGCLVLFHFVVSGGRDSQYSRIRLHRDRNEIEILPALYLSGGMLFKNGDPVERKAGKSDGEWHQYVSTCYFDYMQARKR
jgi:hypothetical protein